MEVFVARQPIFNQQEEIVAYEILYRNSNENSSRQTDGDQATTEVIVNSFLNIGINDLSMGKQSFINFTEYLLQLKVPTYFPPMSIVVEILETVRPTKEVIDICKELKSLGYTIALDDFFLSEDSSNMFTLLQYVDIIKIDFRTTNRKERSEIISLLKPFNITFLAEKVETREEFYEAIEDGYVYYQGYFFSKPVILQSYDIPSFYSSYFQILNEIELPEPDINRISSIIEKDLSLSLKLLKLINSPLFGRRNEISSINQAIVLIGLMELKKWIYVLAIRGMKDNLDESSATREVVHLSLTRAKMGELIGKKHSTMNSSKLFLVGMFSLIDTLLHIPMENILHELPLADDIKVALLGGNNEFSSVLQLIKNTERQTYNNDGYIETAYSLNESELFEIYCGSVKWADHFMSQTEMLKQM